MTKWRRGRGNPPDPAAGWEWLDKYKSDKGVNWDIWIKRQPTHSEWANYKITACGKATPQANYWLGHNFVKNKVTDGGDVEKMKKQRPELHAYVVSVLGKIGNDAS